MRSSSETIYAFIDSQNLNLSIRNDIVSKRTGSLIYSGWKLDFNKFLVYLQDKYQVSKAFLFIGKVDGNSSLYKSLTSYGYTLIYKPTLEYVGDDGVPHIKGNVDAELVLHTMIQMPNYDKAVIVSGDGDYRCLVEYLITIGKLQRLLIPNKYSYSSLLNGFLGNTNFISDLRAKLVFLGS